MTDYQSTATETEAKFFGMILGVQNTKPVRQWGFEAEHPSINTAKNQGTWRDYSQFDLVNDPSVSNEQEDCDCSCSDCRFHECNCDDCDSYNDDPSHCGDEECEGKNELCTAEPVQTFWKAEFNEFLETVRQAEADSRWKAYGENWSGHVHVEARDLNADEARNVVVIATHLFKIAPEWFTGWTDHYNSENDRRDLEAWKNGDGYRMSRQSWVSLTNITWNIKNPRDYQIGDSASGKTTVEFRRFRVTLDPKLIMARGAVCRAIINYAKTNGKQLFYATRHRDFLGLCQELEVGRH